VEGSWIVKLSSQTRPAVTDKFCSCPSALRKAAAPGTCGAAFLDVWYAALAAGMGNSPSPEDLTSHARRALTPDDGLDDVDVLEPVSSRMLSKMVHARPEEAPQIFIRPPVGWEEEGGVVYEVLRPLYGIPSSARALHYTLGCEVTRDRTAKTLTLRQPTYIRRVLAAHGMTDCNPVKTPLETGTRLSARDCPSSPEGNRRRRHHVEPPVVFGQTQPPPWMG